MERLNSIYLNKSSAIPLYEQLRKGILDSIVNEKLPAGSKLPTEEELCEAYDISRPVARQAYSALIEAGYVERLRGKGTFVKNSDNRGRYIDKQLSFAHEMAVLGVEHHTEMVRTEWMPYDEYIYSMLGLQENERCYHLVRMRFVEGKPFILVENFIPESIFPGIDQYNFAETSLYQVFDEVYNTHIARSHRTMSARLATPEVASLLGIKQDAAVMYVKNLVYDENDRPIDLSKEYLDGVEHQYEFEVVNQ